MGRTTFLSRLNSSFQRCYRTAAKNPFSNVIFISLVDVSIAPSHVSLGVSFPSPRPGRQGFASKAQVYLLGQNVPGGPEGFIWGWDGEEVGVVGPQSPGRTVLEMTRLGFRRRLWLSFRVKG